MSDERDIERDDEQGDQPSFAESISAAVRGAGLSQVKPGEAPTAHALLAAMGGVRGLIESILPALGFLVVYTITRQLLPSVLAPLIVAVGFVVVRIVMKSPATSAFVGVLGIAVSAVLALITGRPEDNFIPGFIINGVSVLVLLVSLIVRWPLIGVFVGLLTNDLTGWREDKAKFRVLTIATILWIGLFALRLAVELPLYFAGHADWLAGTKLVLGVPLYAGMLWVTWLLVRTVYPRPQPE